MEILVLSPYKDDVFLYPPVQAFNEVLRRNGCAVTYEYFPGRGLHSKIQQEKPSHFCIVKAYAAKLTRFPWDLTKLLVLRIFRRFDAVIVIDHFLAAVAMWIYPTDHVIFWSHDIICSDSDFAQYRISKILLTANAKLIRNGARLLIQDEDRRALLEESIGCQVPQDRRFIAPIFLTALTSPPPIKRLNGRPKLLQIGHLSWIRHSDELLQHYSENTNLYELLCHGVPDHSFRNALKIIQRRPALSTVLIPSNQLWKIISECHIGFLGYRFEDKNAYLLARASGQAIEFLRLGKPVIVLSHSTLNELINQRGAGIGITSITQLGEAVETIVSQYEKYVKAAKSLFDEDFDPIRFESDLVSWLAGRPSSKQSKA